MISKHQYESAVKQIADAQKITVQYFKERTAKFEERMASNPIFTDEELKYSATKRCPCGHGLAYPKECGAHHYWDCSAILKGVANTKITHEAKLPFAFYDIKTESEYTGTTRSTR